MNQYPIWVGIVVALVMVCLTSNPLWWMLVALGIGANGVVCAANGWKMPVRGVLEETIRHRPMEATTRHKWLGDFIPTGFGKASIGDFLLAAGMLGAIAARAYIPTEKVIAALCLFWWGSGWVKGFGLFEKWTAEARRDARKNIPIVLLLLVIGNLLHVRGCSISELHASASSMRGTLGSGVSLKTIKNPPQAKWRDLGKVLAPTDFLKRLRIEEADRDAKAAPQRKADAALKAKIQKQLDQIQRDPVSHVQKLRIRDLQKTASASTFNVVSQTNNSFIYTTWDGTVGRWSTQTGDEVLAPAIRQPASTWPAATVTSSSPFHRIGTRKGPFCRVTCEFHHKDNLGAGSGDVEVEASYCNTQHINQQDSVVPGWVQLNAQYEQKNDWPGPAQGGLDSYKLYWK